MAQINVRRDNSDPFYRYKMERLQTKIEGKGNGIKTVIVNLPAVAQALARPEQYIIKYFGFELGAQTTVGKPSDDRWIINGAHEASKLQDLLDGFINKFVLCKTCKNPETVVNIKDGRIFLDCKAGGERSDVDIRHKLSSFILKEQPKKGKKDKADRKAARKAKQNGHAKENGGSGNGTGSDGIDGSENGNNDDEDDGAISDQEFNKMQAEADEAAEDVKVQDDEWAVDMSEEAVKARQAQLPGEFKAKLNLDDDGEAGGNTLYDQFGDWIQEQSQSKGGIDNMDSIEIYLKAKEMGIEGKHLTVAVLVQTLFTENICAQIPKRAGMLKQVITSERHQKALLGGTERLVGENQDKLLPQVVKILQLYYHHDLIEEEVVTHWGNTKSKKYTDINTSKKVRVAAKPFLQWLEDADEEESSEEE